MGRAPRTQQLLPGLEERCRHASAARALREEELLYLGGISWFGFGFGFGFGLAVAHEEEAAVHARRPIHEAAGAGYGWRVACWRVVSCAGVSHRLPRTHRSRRLSRACHTRRACRRLARARASGTCALRSAPRGRRGRGPARPALAPGTPRPSSGPRSRRPQRWLGGGCSGRACSARVHVASRGGGQPSRHRRRGLSRAGLASALVSSHALVASQTKSRYAPRSSKFSRTGPTEGRMWTPSISLVEVATEVARGSCVVITSLARTGLSRSDG